MNRNRIRHALTGSGLGLLCMGFLAAAIGCSRESPQERAVAAGNREVSRGQLGVELSASDNLVAITKVEPQSPADDAGLQAGDELVSVDGKPITSTNELQSQIQTALKNDGNMAIKVRRNGTERTVRAELESGQTARDASGQGGQQSPDQTSGNKQADAQKRSKERELDSAPNLASTKSATSESAPADRDLDKSKQAGRQVVNRMPVDKAAQSPNRSDDDGGKSGRAADQRPQLASSSKARSDDGATEPTRSSGTAAEQPSAKSDRSANAPTDQREISLQEVEAKLDEAKEALDGFISQKNKVLEYQEKMEAQLRDFDQRVATLEDDVKQLQERLTEKQQHLDAVRKKRQEFVAQIENLDPATANSWIETRKRINAAWLAMEEAYRDVSSDKDQ